MKKHPYSFNEFFFKENNAIITRQEFTGNLKIEGFTECGAYKFEYKEWEKEQNKD